MIIFVPIGKKGYNVINKDTKEFYPKDKEPVSFTECWNSTVVKSWLPKKFKIEEI